MKNFIVIIIQYVLHIFFLFPIKKNRVIFSSYSGKAYNCNPKYISEYICEHDNNNDIEIIWAFCNLNKFNNLDERIIQVKYKSIKYLYYLLTAGVVIDNVESWSILPRRAGQYVVNTWHGGGAYKGVGLRRKDTNLFQDNNMLRKNKRIDLYLSSSRAFSYMTIKKSFGYNGQILECGMPRNDILIKRDEDNIAEIRDRLFISNNKKIVLYAPTFRNDFDFDYLFNYKIVLAALEEKTNNDWIMLYRCHYYRNSDVIDNNEGVYDVSEYPDMQELLLISDVLITDYSSSMWDFSLMGKPGYLYVPDLVQYNNERDFYTPIEEWPYPYAKSMDELVDLIENYSDDSIIKKIEHHHKKLGNFEKGNATIQASELIIKILLGKG